MRQANERGYGAPGERGSALWGTGSRGGDSRSSVLWGKGGRGMITMVFAALALAAPIVASADSGNKNNSGGGNGKLQAGWADPTLLANAKKTPDQLIPVIIQSESGTVSARSAFRGLGGLNTGSGNGRSSDRDLNLVNGISAELPAKLVEKLAKIPGITVTYDAPVQLSGTVQQVLSSADMWPYETGNAALWSEDQTKYASALPTIAIVDSGIQASRADFAGRILADVNLTTLGGNSPGDGRGHGTFVAGVAAGAGANLAGAAPGAKLVSLDVMDDNGMARTSDVIAAAQWILDNKDKYNIRVANFSLHSTTPSNFWRDPLDKAVEKLWFAGVTVVVAAGNYGKPDGPSGVPFAPGNDPFVITVGALDTGKSFVGYDDTVAPWSAWGRTYDGFFKPEVAAPGRYITGPIAPSSTLTVVKAANMIGTDRIQLSGTSFAAPVVSGTVAQMIARHPNWTPGQVKAALMVTASKVNRDAAPAGAGAIRASVAAKYAKVPPDANRALMQFVAPDALTGAKAFNGPAWYSAAKANPVWDAVSWSDVSWSDVSWNEVSWSDVSWSDAALIGSVAAGAVSWSDVSWSDSVSWSDASQEDAAESDAPVDPAELQFDAGDLAALMADPELAVPTDLLPVDAVELLTASTAAPVVATETVTLTSTSATGETTTVTTAVPAGTTDAAATTSTADATSTTDAAALPAAEPSPLP